MTMTAQLNLGKYLSKHNLSAYALMREVKGQVSASTVYGLARKPVRRIDLVTIYTLLDALERIQGKPVEIQEVIERGAQPAPQEEADLSHLKLPAGPTNLNKKFKYSGPGKRVNLPSGTVTRLASEGREP